MTGQYHPGMDQPRRPPKRRLITAKRAAGAFFIAILAASAPFWPFHGANWDVALWAAQGLSMLAVAVVASRARQGEDGQPMVAEP
jgi:hypothetical protein